MKPFRSGLLLLLASVVWAQAAFCAPASVVETSASEIINQARGEADRTLQSADSYIIGPHNLLQIKIFGESNTNSLYRVDEDGYIRHALVGRIQLGGLTISGAEELLEKTLDKDYILNPQVNVFVLEFSQFSIIGEVRRPGNYELSGKVSIIKAISIAGGFTPVASQKDIKIIRKNEKGRETTLKVDTTRITGDGDLTAQVYLQADDVVVVAKSFF